MTVKTKSSILSAPSTQGELIGRIIINFRVFILFGSLLCLIMFWVYTRSITQRIETYYHISLPESTRDIYFFHDGSDTPTISRFTINFDDFARVLMSAPPNTEIECMILGLDPDYKPEFSEAPQFDWWNPQTLTNYAGSSCFMETNSERQLNSFMMVDFTSEDEVTLYFESYIIENGERIGFD